MNTRIIITGMLLVLSACGGESNDSAQGGNSANSAKSADSALNAYLASDKVCDILSAARLQSISGGASEINKRDASYRENFACTYSWPRPDAAEREKNMVQATIASMTGNGPKMTLRDRMTDFEVTIAIQKSERSANSFVPRKLTEAQMEEQLAAAKKRTEETLTDQQKKLAGDAANSMVERLLRKNNENEVVAGIGDAAFWSSLGMGSLQVLDGNVQLTISPIMADTKQADMEKAKQVATLL